MRITLNELRALIKEQLINEGAVTPIQAASDGVALFSSENSSNPNSLYAIYVLYRATGHRNSIAEATFEASSDSVETAANWAVIGAVKVAKSQGGEPSYIEDVVTKVSGYGPLLYDIALKYHSPILDRRGLEDANVSPEASKVWDFYAKKRKKDTSYQNQLLSLKSKLSVDVQPLITAHNNLPNKIYANPRSSKVNLPSMPTFTRQLDSALYQCGKDILRSLHM